MLTHQQTASQEAAAAAYGCGWTVSVTYEDGACLRLRLAAPEAAAGGAAEGGGGRARVVASLSSPDGVHVTLGVRACFTSTKVLACVASTKVLACVTSTKVLAC